MNTIGARLIKARKRAGLYQYQVAAKAHCTQSTIAKLEKDRGSSEFFTMVEIARALGVSLDWIAFGDINEKSTDIPAGAPANSARMAV